MFNPYEVLGVSDNSDLVLCKKAYRKLCIQYHPDNGGNADMYHRVCKAYEMIKGGYKKRVVVPKKKQLRHNTLFTYSVVE